MTTYNYANEIIKEYDQPDSEESYKRILISTDTNEDDFISFEHIKNDNISGKVKGFNEGLRNDNISTEQKA